MATVIYYGAGKNLCDYEEQFVKESGMPICICDKDTSKQGNVFRFKNDSEVPIVSLQDALNSNPDYELWLTLAENNLPCVYDYLLKENKVPADRIKFFGDREYRLGCFNLSNYIYISSGHVKTCAHYPYTNHFMFEENQVLTEQNLISKLDELEAWRRDTTDKLRKGEKTTCHGVYCKI